MNYRVIVCGLVSGGFLCSGQTTAIEGKLEAEAKALMQIKVASITGATMGAVVKGAPYSATEVTENDQTLGDGTRIHNESQTKVYRDGQGRIRQETGARVTIWDPVAQAGYLLNTDSLAAQKLPYSSAMLGSKGDAKVVYFSGNGANSISVGDKISLDEIQKMQISKGIAEAAAASSSAAPSTSKTFTFSTSKARTAGTEESLGVKVMEGVSAEGRRFKSTIAAGAIGNDRPIETVSERWYSPDLSIPVMTHRSDPRTGDETFRVTNIIRGEPSPNLFQVPAGYQITDRK